MLGHSTIVNNTHHPATKLPSLADPSSSHRCLCPTCMDTPSLVLIAASLHDPICTMLPEFLGFWCIRSCRIYIINRWNRFEGAQRSCELRSIVLVDLKDLDPI